MDLYLKLTLSLYIIVNFPKISSLSNNQFQYKFKNPLSNLLENNNKRNEDYYENLKQKIVKKQETFGIMKEELLFARGQNNIKKKKFFIRANDNQENVVVKREDINNNDKNKPSVANGDRTNFRSNSKSLSNICINEVCGKNNTQFEELTPMEMGMVLGRMDEKYEQFRTLTLEAIVPSLLRGDIEDLEKLYMPDCELIEKLTHEDSKNGDPTFKIPESMAKTHELSLHYSRWKYILKNRVKNFANLETMKDILIEAGITDEDDMARYITLFFENTSQKLHHTMKKLSVSDIKKGLIENGVKDVNFINTGLTIFAIRRGKEQELMSELINIKK